MDTTAIEQQAMATESEARVRLLVTVTLNPNQLRAHLEPILLLPELGAVTLVADEAPPPMPKLRVVVPPPTLVRVLGRAGAKLVVCLVLAVRERPDWVFGYNLVPHGLTALFVGKLTRRKTLFHMIGGPVEIEGGGWQSDNAVLGRLPRPFLRLERGLLRLARAYTVVAVMGQGARRLLVAGGVPADRVIPIPASVDGIRFQPRPVEHREYALITVSQLIPRKRLEDFLEAVAQLRVERPWLRAAVVGTGPLRESLRTRAADLGIAGAVDFLGFRVDVEDLYSRSEIFVLTSRYEGLSIALTEAMASGLPAVVSDVGEARDVVVEGVNGHLFPVGDVSALVRHVSTLLENDERRRGFARAAARDVRAVAGIDRVTDLYRKLLGGGPA